MSYVFYIRYCLMFVFFFFQAEDGIRDLTVTGVQTCALPISTSVALVSSSTACVSSPAPGDRPIGGSALAVCCRTARHHTAYKRLVLTVPGSADSEPQNPSAGCSHRLH